MGSIKICIRYKFKFKSLSCLYSNNWLNLDNFNENKYIFVGENNTAIIFSLYLAELIRFTDKLDNNQWSIYVITTTIFRCRYCCDIVYYYYTRCISIVLHISYRVTGLYQLGKTCYLHSLLCNNSIIAQFPVKNDIISICTWENDSTANSHATSNTWLVTCHCLRINRVTKTPHGKTTVGVLTRQHAAQR